MAHSQAKVLRNQSTPLSKLLPCKLGLNPLALRII